MCGVCCVFTRGGLLYIQCGAGGRGRLMVGPVFSVFLCMWSRCGVADFLVNLGSHTLLTYLPTYNIITLHMYIHRHICIYIYTYIHIKKSGAK